MKSFAYLCLLLLPLLSSAISNGGSRLLVILEDVADKSKYSKYFADLEERQYTLSFETPKSEDLALFDLGERAYDHVLLLPIQSKGLGPKLTPKLLLDFVNAGGNILLTLSGKTPTPTSIVSVLLELDVHLPMDRSAYVVDHFEYETKSAAEQHDVILLPRPMPIRSDVRDFFGGEHASNEVIVFPRGVGQILGNDSPLLVPILRAPRTAYSFSPKADEDAVDDTFEAGKQLSLVTAMQARNSARFTVLGSAELLEDAWFDAKVQGRSFGKDSKVVNRAFAKEVTGWTFYELGVLKVNSISHRLDEPGTTGNSTNPNIYRIKSDVTYEISLSEYTWDSWKPFVPPTGDDVQLEFSMLSPFHRLPLKPVQTTANATVYSASLRTPDQHGIFNFMVNYKRPFYNNIVEKKQVTVRHFAHDEYQRSWEISGAWPWISGLSVTITGWLGFVAIWLWSRRAKSSGRGGIKKTQ